MAASRKSAPATKRTRSTSPKAQAKPAQKPRAPKPSVVASRGAARPPEQDDPAAVAAFIEALDHPLAPILDAVRKAILAIDGTITAGIKWNCPSFYLNGWFATLNIRKDRVFLVLHQGVKTRKDSTIRSQVPDPDGLLTWHAPDRASLTFESEAAFRNRRKAFDAIIAAWAHEQAKL